MLTENQKLFAILKQAIPDLPENTKRLTLIMIGGSVPTVECLLVVKNVDSVVEHTERFSLHSIDTENAPPPVTKIG